MVQKLNHFLFRLYALKFFSAVVFLYPVMAVMFQSNGVSDFGISALLISWALFVLLFQPIIGNFGDKYSRKNILLIGQLCKLACFAIFLTIPNFYGYMIGFVFWAIQWAIEASVADAFIYDELKALRATKRYIDVSGKAYAFQNAGLLLSSVGSFIVAAYGYDFVLIITAIAMFLSFLFAASIKMNQPTSYKQEKSLTSIIHAIRSGLNLIKKLKLILAVIVLSCIIAIADSDDYLSLFGTEIGIPLQLLGIMFAISRIAEISGGFAAKFIPVPKIKTLGIWVVLVGILLIAKAFSNAITIYPILFAVCLLYSITRVHLLAKIQNILPSNKRCMTLSLFDVINQVSMMIFYGLMAFGAYLSGYWLGYFIFGVVMITIGIISIIYLNELKLIKTKSVCRPC